MTGNDQDKTAPENLTDDDLKDAEGGIALLLPAVQKVRDAARRTVEVDQTALQQNLTAKKK